MKVVIINKSDSVGGAAVVSRRLMYALRDKGVDARMLVCDKRHESPHVETASTPNRIKRSFLAERLKIFMANGMNRDNLFKVDIAGDGLPLSKHRWVREADVVCLDWVNQGMLSLRGVRELTRLGKPVIWTMHDMWNFTGICHHAGACKRWQTNCGLCPFLGKMSNPEDLSFKVWNNKRAVYSGAGNLHFVAVSNWLADQARQSPLLSDMPLSVIPNAFPIPDDAERLRAGHRRTHEHKFRIVMGAARLDDPVKGLPILVEATRILRDEFPEEAEVMELVTFGNLKDANALDGVGLSHTHLGTVAGEDNVRDIYLGADAVVSTSLYETLPGTLVEGQVYGCIPVSFGRGGQSDIVDHGKTGYIATWDDDMKKAARAIAEGLVWARRQDAEKISARMLASARSKFAAPVIAEAYLSLIDSLMR